MDRRSSGSASRSAVGVCALLALIPADAAAQAPPADGDTAEVAAVAWLSGCWEAVSGDRRAREVWMVPDGGLMVGMSRSVRGGRPTGFEFLLLSARDGRLVYGAHPSGQQPTDFVSVRVGPGELVVTNPEHDFPRRIEYRLRGTDSLTATVFAEAEGGEAAFALRYARVACQGGAAAPSG